MSVEPETARKRPKKRSADQFRSKLILGLQSKQLGFVECLAWHLFEVGELLPLGLPTGPSKQALLAQAIEVSGDRVWGCVVVREPVLTRVFPKEASRQVHSVEAVSLSLRQGDGV